MDPWVNSLVQSPLVRSLNTIPARMSSFAHGVKDNVPPFSYTKQVIQPYSTSTDSPVAAHKFRIPQSGILNRVYLRMRLNSKAGTGTGSSTTADASIRTPWTGTHASASATVGAAFAGKTKMSASSSWNYADALRSVQLSTHARPIETIPGECIANEVNKMPIGERKFFEKGMAGYAAGIYKPGTSLDDNIALAGTSDVRALPADNSRHDYAVLWDPSASALKAVDSSALTAGASNEAVRNYHSHADFIIPLPFSTLNQLKDNLQTRFVEDLEITVNTQSYKRGIQERSAQDYDGNVTLPTLGKDYYVCELVCIFHNFHDVIENAIRDQNYKRGFPASIYCHDYTEETVVAASKTQFRVDFSSNNLVNEIIIVRQLAREQWTDSAGTAQYPTVLGNSYSIGGYNMKSGSAVVSTNKQVLGSLNPLSIPSYKVTFSASGRELMSSWDHELAGPDTADYELADGHAYGADSAHGRTDEENVSQSPTIFMNQSASTAHFTSQGGVLLGFGRNLRVLRFGFQSNSNFYTGGIGFQTLSNPTLTIDSGDGTTAWEDHRFRVYVKYSTMLRIDSDTGVLTRTLDV